MTCDSLFTDITLPRFVADHYQRLPYSAAGRAASLCELGSWSALAAILEGESTDLLVCRRNEQYTGPAPRCEQEALALVEQGYTLLVRHAERHDDRLAQLAAEFQTAFAAPVNIHMYCTPGGQYGFGWHYDAEEVFIVQTTGRKEYRLRKNTVNPWPIEETLPANMRYEREIMPLVKCELAAGDWLYIPSGYWHMGESRETALSLAIGVEPRTGVDVYNFLRQRVVESLRWRQRLPVAGTAAVTSDDELRQQYLAVFHQLAADFGKLLTEPKFADDFLSQIRAAHTCQAQAPTETR
jgi:ribosomal protein L16 Arg81 hydroxylase